MEKGKRWELCKLSSANKVFVGRVLCVCAGEPRASCEHAVPLGHPLVLCVDPKSRDRLYAGNWQLLIIGSVGG